MHIMAGDSRTFNLMLSCTTKAAVLRNCIDHMFPEG